MLHTACNCIIADHTEVTNVIAISLPNHPSIAQIVAHNSSSKRYSPVFQQP